MPGYSSFDSGWDALLARYGNRLADRPGRIPTKTLFWLALYATNEDIIAYENIPRGLESTASDIRASARRQLASILRLTNLFADAQIEET